MTRSPSSHPTTTMADTNTDLALKETGGGWFEIARGDEVLDKVQGKDAAEARLAELAASGSDGDAEKAKAETAEPVAVKLLRTVPATMVAPGDYRGPNRQKGETIYVGEIRADELVAAGHAERA